MPVICPKPGHWGPFFIVDSYESRDLTLQTLSSVMVISWKIGCSFLFDNVRFLTQINNLRPNLYQSLSVDAPKKINFTICFLYWQSNHLGYCKLNNLINFLFPEVSGGWERPLSFPYPNLESSNNSDLYLYLTSQGSCIGNYGARHSKYNFKPLSNPSGGKGQNNQDTNFKKGG